MLWKKMREVSAYCHPPRKHESIYYGLSAKIFPTYFCLVCRLYPASLGIHTEHPAEIIVASFVKQLKSESFNSGFWPLGQVSTFKPAVNEEDLPNIQSRMLFRDCRQTVLLLYLSSSI